MLPMIIPLLTSVVPSIVDLFTSDDESRTARIARKAAHIVKDVANITNKNLTEEQHLTQAADIIRTNPEKFIALQQRLNELTIEEYRAQSERLRIINDTMRVEAISGDPWQRRWRPMWGYITGFAFGIQIIGVTILILVDPTHAPEIISALVGLTGLWSVALGVLGVAVWQRSSDKARASGHQGPSLIGALATRIARTSPSSDTSVP